MTGALPRLLDRKAIAAELGVPLHTAERIMRRCPIVKVDRRVFVTAEAVDQALKTMTITSSGTSESRRT